MKGLFSKQCSETYCECGVTYTFDPDILKKQKGFFEVEYMWYYIPEHGTGKRTAYIFAENENDAIQKLSILINHWNRNDGHFKYVYLYQIEGGLSKQKAGEYTKREMIEYFSNLLKRATDTSVKADPEDERYYGGASDAYRIVISFLKRNKIKGE